MTDEKASPFFVNRLDQEKRERHERNTNALFEELRMRVERLNTYLLGFRKVEGAFDALNKKVRALTKEGHTDPIGHAASQPLTFATAHLNEAHARLRDAFHSVIGKERPQKAGEIFVRFRIRIDGEELTGEDINEIVSDIMHPLDEAFDEFMRAIQDMREDLAQLLKNAPEIRTRKETEAVISSVDTFLSARQGRDTIG